MSHLDEIDAIVSKGNVAKHPGNSSYLDEIDAVVAKGESARKEAERISKLREGTTTEQFVKGLFTGAGSTADFVAGLKNKILPESMADKNAGRYAKNMGDLYHKAAGYFTGDSSEFKPGVTQEIGEFFSPGFGDKPLKAVKLAGKGMNFATNLGKKLLTRGAESAGAVAGTHLMPEISDSGYEKIIGAVTGSLLGGRTAGKLTAGKAAHSLTKEEQQIADMAIKQIKSGKQSLEDVISSLENQRNYASGYNPTTAEVTGNTALSQLERSRMGINPILKEAKDQGIEDLQSYFHDYARTTPSGKLPTTANPFEGGEALTNAIHADIDVLKDARRHVTEPLYQSAREANIGVTPSKTGETLDRILEHSINPESEIYSKIRKNITERGPEVYRSGPLSNQYMDAITARMNARTPQELEAAWTKFPAKKNLNLDEVSSSQLADQLNKINERIKDIKHFPNRAEEVANLKKLRNSLYEDLGQVPEWGTANAKYREMSEPINKIIEDPTLKKFTKVEKGYAGVQSHTEDSLFRMATTGTGSVATAKKLKPILQNNPAEYSMVKKSIRENFLDSVMDVGTGKLSLDKVKNYHTKNAGALELYPELYGDMIRSGVLQKPLLENIYKNAIEPGTAASFNRYMKTNEHVINRFLSNEQIEILKEIGDIYKRRAEVARKGGTGGSSTHANSATLAENMTNPAGRRLIQMGLGAAADLLLGMPGTATVGSLVYDTIAQSKATKSNRIRMEVLDKMLSDPDYAKLLLSKPFKSSKDYNIFLKDASKYAIKQKALNEEE